LKRSCGLPSNNRREIRPGPPAGQNRRGRFRRKTLRRILVILALCTLGPGLFHRPAAAENSPGIYLTAEAQYAYAKHLYDTGAFREAVAEFKRFIHFFPDDSRIDAAWYFNAMALFQTREYPASIRSFQVLIRRFEASPLLAEAHHRISEAYLKLGDPGQALITLFNLAALAEDPAQKDAAYYQAGWIYIETAQWDRARAAFEHISPAGRDRLDLRTLLERMETQNRIPRKEPQWAGLLAVIPGAVHLYCERYRDALTAFIVNGLVAWAAIEAFDNDRPALGGLLSIVGLGFYSGSIYGSVSGAHQFNQNRSRRFIDSLKTERKTVFSAVPRPDGIALVMHFHF